MSEWFHRDKHLPALAAAMMDGPDRLYGYELSRATGVRSGVVFPLLTRLLAAGWITDGWETADEARDPRYPRRYYVLTDDGRAMLGSLAVVSR